MSINGELDLEAVERMNAALDAMNGASRQQQPYYNTAGSVVSSAVVARNKMPPQVRGLAVASESPLAAALIEAFRCRVGDLGFSYVEAVYLPRALVRCLGQGLRHAHVYLTSADCDTADIAVIRMQNGDVGVVALPKSVMELAVAQETARTLAE